MANRSRWPYWLRVLQIKTIFHFIGIFRSMVIKSMIEESRCSVSFMGVPLGYRLRVRFCSEALDTLSYQGALFVQTPNFFDYRNAYYCLTSRYCVI